MSIHWLSGVTAAPALATGTAAATFRGGESGLETPGAPEAAALPAALPFAEGTYGTHGAEAGLESHLQAAVDKINTRLAPKDLEAHYAMDDTTHRLVIKVVDRKDDTIVLQIPTEKALALAVQAAQADSAHSALLNERV